MSKDIILQSTTSDELINSLVEKLKEECPSIFTKKGKDDNRLLTRKEVAKILGISLPTLSTWTKNGTIKALRINGTTAVRYRQKDVDNVLKNIESIKYSRF